MDPYVSISTGRGGDGTGEGVGVGGHGGNVGNVTINLNNMQGSTGIARLMSVRARHAEYDSARTDALSPCLEGTRVDILAHIMSWLGASDENTHPVYWLNGLAGIGKSTIATSVAERAKEKGMLGATFFFSRADRTLHDPHTVFPTLAFQLAKYDNRFKSVIVEALEKDEGIEDGGLLRQLEGLIVDPLLRIHPKQHPTLIILDALDECEEGGAKTILQLLFSHATRIPFLRIFITSRPEFHISSVFNQFDNYAKTILHNVEASVIQQDIELYIRTELAKIPQRLSLSMPADWTTEAEKHALLEKSGKLFIFAATCIRFIGDDRALAPQEHLALILGTQPLEGGDPSEVTPYKQLDHLYTTLLHMSLSDSNPRLVQNRFQIVIGSIVLLRQPLPLRSLARFVEKNMGMVNSVLRHLQSVIIPPYDENDVPHIYHPSFVDFITSPLRCTIPGFLIVPVPVQEQRHALRCFCLMDMYLKQDAAGIKDASLLNSEVDGFEAKVASALPVEAQYACQFWASHLLEVEVGDEKVMEALEEFVMQLILWWIEAMSLLGSIHTVGRTIQEVHQWAIHSKCQLTVITMLADAHRFILAHAEVIRMSALQIYQSALPFTPHGTALYKVYCKETSNSIHVLQGMDPQWSQCVASFHGHLGNILCIACSKDGLQLASGSFGGSIQLWDLTSGLLITILQGHTGTVDSVAFSPDGSQLASGSSDFSVQLWDATSGIPTKVLRGHSGDVMSVAFSPDGLTLASGSSDHSIHLWDVASGVPITILEGHTRQVMSVAFSPDGSQLASGSADSFIWLWDAKLGTPVAIIGDHTGWVYSIAFSPDGLQLAACNGGLIQLWDTTSHTLIAVLGGCNSLVHSVAFSLDGMQLASGCIDKSVQVWDTTSGTLLLTLRGHTGSVHSVVFTPDGLLLAADSSTSSVQLWDTTLDMSIAPLAGHSDRIRSLTFSPDGLQLASGSTSDFIQLWDAISGKAIGILQGYTASLNSMAFSPDGLRLASADGSCIRLWDTLLSASLAILKGHTSRVNSVSFSLDGLRLASVSDDYSIRLWDAISGAPIAVLRPHSPPHKYLIFSPDGLQLVSASRYSSVRLWNLVSGTSTSFRTGHVISGLAFSIDGQTLIVKGGTETSLWDCTSQPPHCLDSKSSTVMDPSFAGLISPIWSCDGRWITMRRFPSNHVRRICYIPPSYNPDPTISIVDSALQSRVAFACTDGRVVLLDTQHCL